MGTHASPDITSPVTRGQSASTGILQNIGTAQGSNGIGGFVNNSLGGSVDRGSQSFSNAAKSPSAVVANTSVGGGGGGGSFAVSTSSVNPKSIQDDSSAFKNGETVVATTPGTTVVNGAGQDTIYPKSAAVELPTNSVKVHVLPSATIAATTAISYNGIDASLVTGSVNDNVLNQNKVSVAKAEMPAGHDQSGGNSFGPEGLPTSSVQVRDTKISGPNNSIPFQNSSTDKP